MVNIIVHTNSSNTSVIHTISTTSNSIISASTIAYIIFGIIAFFIAVYVVKKLLDLYLVDQINKKNSLAYTQKITLLNDLELNKTANEKIFFQNNVYNVLRKKYKENDKMYILYITNQKMLKPSEKFIFISKASYDKLTIKKIKKFHKEISVIYLDNVDFEFYSIALIETAIRQKASSFIEDNLNWRIYSNAISENYYRAQMKNAVISNINLAGNIEADNKHNDSVANAINKTKSLHTSDMSSVLDEKTTETNNKV